MPEPQIFEFMPIIWSFIGILVAVLAYKLSKFWITTRLDTKASLKMQVEDLKQLAEHHRKEAQRWRGRVGQITAKPTVEQGEADPEDPDQFIPKLIQSYGHMAPDWLKPILKDDGMIKFLIDEAKKHPDAAKSMLSQFIGKPKGRPEAGQLPPGQSSADELSEFA